MTKPPGKYETASDGQLLAWWVESADETALRAIVSRHLPFLTRVAYQMKLPSHEVEDVCQTVVVKLIEKASTIRNRDSLASWLYSVTQRTALESRRHKLQTVLPGDVEPMSNAKPIEDREQLHLLHEELGKLPDKYRDPIVLCDLQNRSREFVAEALETTEAAIKARLERGRKLLKRRLLTRGVTFTSVVAMWHASSATAAEWISGPVVEELVRNGLSIKKAAVAGRLSSATSLTEGASAMAIVSKNNLLAAAGIALLALSGGGAYYFSTKALPSAEDSGSSETVQGSQPVVLFTDPDFAAQSGSSRGEWDPYKVGRRTINTTDGNSLDSAPSETRDGFIFAANLFQQLYASSEQGELNRWSEKQEVISNLQGIKAQFPESELLELSRWRGTLFKSDIVNGYPDGLRLLIQIGLGSKIPHPIDTGAYREKYLSLLLTLKNEQWSIKQVELHSGYGEATYLLSEQLAEYPEE